MWVVGEASRPWKPPPITAMRYRRSFGIGPPRGGNWTTMHSLQLLNSATPLTLISGLPCGTPPSRALTSVPRTSSASARRRFVVGP